MKLWAANFGRVGLLFCAVSFTGFLNYAGANTISVPTDFLIAEGQSGAVPVTATFSSGATPVGIDFSLQYDSNVIEVFGTGSTAVQQVGTATANWNKEHNVVTVSGSTKEIRISAAAVYENDGLPPGSSTLFNIVFQAVSTADTMSSPLTITMADLNEVAVPTTNDGSVRLTGATGVLTLSPDPVKPGRNVVVELTDENLDTSGTAEIVSVTINSRLTAGGSIKETHSIDLTETGGATGVFSGAFSTTYGATALGGAVFEVEPGNFLYGEYTDSFGSTGVSEVITNSTEVVAGVTGGVTTSPPSLSAGATLTVTVNDADLNDPDANDEVVEVSVVRFVAGSMTIVDTEFVTVTGSGSGVTIPTSSSAGTSGDNTLNVGSGDQIVAKYDDPLGNTGAMVPGLLSINPVAAVFDNVPSLLEVRAPLSFDLSDSDIFDGTRIVGNSEVRVEVFNTTTGESELLEASSSSDPFSFTIATIFSGGSSTSPDNNGALGIKPGDTVVAKYTDNRDASLGSTVVTSTNIAVATGTTGTVSTSPNSIAAGDPLTVTLIDDDLAGNIGGIYAGDVVLIVRRNGVDIILQDIVADLVETPFGSGTFIATISTGGLGLLPGDRLLVSYDDAAGGSGVPENNVLSISTDDGSFGALPATISVGDSLPIVLTDTDMQQPTYVIGVGALNAVAKNLSNGDTEAVTLTETLANSGTFTYGLTTVFTTGATAPNSGDLEVQPGDFLQVIYADPRGASGIQTEIVSTIVEVLAGGDGSATVSPSPSFSLGSSISVTVIDEDLGNSGNINVTLRSKRSGSTIETETLSLSAVGSGFQFTGAIATSFASGATSGSGGVLADDLILQLQVDDSVRVEYFDAITSGGGSSTVLSGSTVATGGTSGNIVASRLLEGGDVLRIEITDADLNVSISSAETAIVSVNNLTNGDIENVLLTETGPNTGIFRAAPTDVTGSGAASSDGIVQVNAHDTLTVSYVDQFDALGASTTFVDSVYGLKWGDNSDNDKLGALDASQILQYTVQNIVFSSYQTAVSNVDAASGPVFGEILDITALDAVYVLKRIVGIISEFPAQSAVPDPHPYKKSVDQRVLAFGETHQIGNSLRLPILLDETRDVVSGMLKLSYDPTQYRVSAVKTSEATEGYLIASRIEAGSVWVALAGAQSQHAGEAAVIEVELEAIGAMTEQVPMVLEAATFNGGWIQAVAAERSGPSYGPRDFSLSPNFPNPFNPETTLRYALPQSGSVELTIYDMLGQKIRALVNEVQVPGIYTVQWNGRDDHGFAVASGLYFYRIQVGNFIQTRKMTLIR